MWVLVVALAPALLLGAGGAVGAGVVLAAAAPWPGGQGQGPGGQGQDERRDLTRLVSEAGEELLQTGLALTAGDRFVAPDDRIFQVTAVRDGIARARLVGRLDGDARMPPRLLRPPVAAREGWPGQTWFGEAWLGEAGPGVAVRAAVADPLSLTGASVPLAARARDVRVAIYHTHSDESYLPDSGRTNEPWNGDILRVGAAMARVLTGHGLDVLHSTRRHDPHDGMAYARSRRTALALLRRRPDALFDVHRDTPPASVYLRRIAGQPVTSVLLVVGRQNPNIRANEAFAFTIKGYADRAYPGLIRGILYAAGDYNQDLFPRAMLAEVGSTYNRLEHARTGARLFGNVVAAMLADIVPAPGLPRPDFTAEQNRASRRGWQTAALLVTLTVAGFSLYLIINEQSYEQLSRLKARLAPWLASVAAEGRRRLVEFRERLAELFARLRSRVGPRA